MAKITTSSGNVFLDLGFATTEAEELLRRHTITANRCGNLSPVYPNGRWCCDLPVGHIGYHESVEGNWVWTGKDVVWSGPR